jgi:hypothetical protein
MLKWFGVGKRRDGVEHAQFIEQWQYVHGPHFAYCVRPLRYTLTFYTTDDGSEPEYDGTAVLWLRDHAHLDDAFGPTRSPHLGADGFGKLLHRTQGFRLTTMEEVLVDGAPLDGAEKLVLFANPAAGADKASLAAALRGRAHEAAAAHHADVQRATLATGDARNSGPFAAVVEVHAPRGLHATLTTAILAGDSVGERLVLSGTEHQVVPF